MTKERQLLLLHQQHCSVLLPLWLRCAREENSSVFPAPSPRLRQQHSGNTGVSRVARVTDVVGVPRVAQVTNVVGVPLALPGMAGVPPHPLVQLHRLPWEAPPFPPLPSILTGLFIWPKHGLAV